MRVNTKRLNLPGKQYYWIEELWPGIDPRANYVEQAATIGRSMDNISYLEKAWEKGIVVALFFIPDRNGILQLVCVDSLDELNSHLKQNEAHVILPPGNRKVSAMASWDSGRDSFIRMIARTKVRSLYEDKGKIQPNESTLEAESAAIVNQISI